jgi:hypothetical protein
VPVELFGPIAGGVSAFSGGIQATVGGNTSGTLTLVSSGVLLLAGGNNITLSQVANAVTISGPGATSPFFVEVNGPVTGTFAGVADLTAASFSHRPIIQPFYQPGNALRVKTARIYVSRTAGVTLNATMGLGFYTMGNSTSLALVSSGTQNYSLTASSDWSGVRAIEFTGLSNLMLSQGPWFVGFHLSASNTSTAVGQVQLVGPAPLDSNFTAGTLGTGANVSSAASASRLLAPFMGVYSAVSAALPANIAASEMLGSASNQAAAWYALVKEI